MSAVIRDAIIRLKLEQQKSKLEAPDTTSFTRAIDSNSRATRESEKATKEASKSLIEYGDNMKEYVGGTSVHWQSAANASRKGMTEILSHTAEGMEGVGRFVRGIALLSTSTDEDLQKVMHRIAKFQGAFDILAGGTKFVKGLGLAFGPVGMAVAGVSLALAAGGVAWNAWANAAENAKKRAREAREETDKLRTSLVGVGSAAGKSMFDRLGTKEKYATSDAERLKFQAQQREELEIQKRATNKEFQRDAPEFARDFNKAMSGVLNRMTGGAFADGDKAKMETAREYETRRADLTRRQLDQEKQIYDQRQQQIQDSGAATAGFLGAGAQAFQALGGFDAIGNPLAAAAKLSIEKTTAETTKLAEAQSKANAALIGHLVTIQNHIERLTDELNDRGAK